MNIITKPFGILQTLQREITALHEQGLLPAEIVLNEHEYEQLKAESAAGGLTFYTHQALVEKEMYFDTPLRIVPEIVLTDVKHGLLDLANAGKTEKIVLTDDELKKRRKKVKPEDYPADE